MDLNLCKPEETVVFPPSDLTIDLSELDAENINLDEVLNLDDIELGEEDILPSAESFYDDLSISLEDEDDIYPPQPLDRVMEALEQSINYKNAEIVAYRNEHTMNASKHTEDVYAKATKSDKIISSEAITKLLNSVLNVDGVAAFKDKNSYDLAIYRVIYFILVKIRENDSSVDKLLSDYHAKLKGYESAHVEYETLRCTAITELTDRDIRSKKLSSLLGTRRAWDSDLQQLIANNTIIDKQYHSICAILPKLDTLKKFMGKDSKITNKFSREVAEYQLELENQLEILQDAKRALEESEPEFMDTEDGEQLITAPRPTIFRKITLPAFENNVRGYRYMCGNCNTVTFDEHIPVFVNRLPNYKKINLKSQPFETRYDGTTSRAVEIEPVICPHCQSVNLFSAKVTTWLKAYVIGMMNESAAFSSNVKSAVPSWSQLNFSNPYLHSLLSQDECTEVLPSERETKESVKSNPLDTNLDSCLEDFIGFVKTNRVNTRLQTDVQDRNTRYLQSIYMSKPKVLSDIDDLSAMITLLETKPEVAKSILKASDVIVKCEDAKFCLQIKNKIKGDIGNVIFKDILVTDDVFIGLNKPLDELKITEEDTVEVLNKNINEFRDIVNEFIKGYSNIEAIPIKKVNKDKYKNVIASGTMTAFWNEYKHLYTEMLTFNVAHVACSNLASPIVFKGKCATTNFLKAINSYLKISAREAGISFDSIDDKSVDNKYYQPLFDMGEKTGTDKLGLVAVYEALRVTMLIQDSRKFYSVSGIPPEVLCSTTVVSKIPSDKEITELILQRNATCMGDAYNYTYLLEGKSIDVIIEELYNEERTVNQEELSYDDVAGSVYKTAYLFANYVPTDNKGYTIVKGLINEYIDTLNSKTDEELKRVNGLYENK